MMNLPLACTTFSLGIPDWESGDSRSGVSGVSHGLTLYLLGCLVESLEFTIFMSGVNATTKSTPTGLVETNFLSSFFLNKSSKDGQNSPNNMVAYKAWAINFQYEVRSDLRSCFEGMLLNPLYFVRPIVQKKMSA